MRKKKEGPVQADIFAFLTTKPNAVVKPIHEQAMPVKRAAVGGNRIAQIDVKKDV
jgi:putative SOS response-associated peptidase YedK